MKIQMDFFCAANDGELRPPIKVMKAFEKKYGCKIMSLMQVDPEIVILTITEPKSKTFPRYITILEMQ